MKREKEISERINFGYYVYQSIGLLCVKYGEVMLGEKLLIKMWESLTREGVGSLASPWQIKRVGKAHAEVRSQEVLCLAQAEVQADAIKQGKGKLLPDGSFLALDAPGADIDCGVDYLGRIEPELNFDFLDIERIEQQNKVENIQQQINLNRTIIQAEEALGNFAGEPPEEDVDSDWIKRWEECAKNTKGEELRGFWARLLAGEVRSPGKYSLRTLEFIKNLSQGEALAISKLGQFAIGNQLYISGRVKEEFDLVFLLQMDELGVVTGVQGGEVAALEITMNSHEEAKFHRVLAGRNLALIMEGDDPKQQFRLRCYRITKLGEELLSLGDFSTDREYMIELGALIKKHKLDVSLARFEWEGDCHGKYFDSQPL
mgnify:CR=1 FL=1